MTEERKARIIWGAIGAVLMLGSIVAVGIGLNKSLAVAGEMNEATPDFHSYVDLNQFCGDANLGYYALGYRQEKPWVDQVLCIGPEGVHEVNATVNGAKVTKTRVTATKGEDGAYWVNTPMFSNHVSLLDDAGHTCPNGEKPLAIIAAEADVTGYGITIKRGHPLCMMDGDLVLVSNAPPEQKINDVVDRWTNFTPTL